MRVDFCNKIYLINYAIVDVHNTIVSGLLGTVYMRYLLQTFITDNFVIFSYTSVLFMFKTMFILILIIIILTN